MSRDPPALSDSTDHQLNHAPDDMEENKHQENNCKPENHQKLPTEALSSRFLDGKVSDMYLNFLW